MEKDLVEARDLLEKAAALMENAGWPGYAIEIADMVNAVAAAPPGLAPASKLSSSPGKALTLISYSGHRIARGLARQAPSRPWSAPSQRSRSACSPHGPVLRSRLLRLVSSSLKIEPKLTHPPKPKLSRGEL